MAVDLGEELFTLSVAHQKMPESANSGFIGNRAFTQVNTGKTAHGNRVVLAILCSRIGETEPLLQEVDS